MKGRWLVVAAVLMSAAAAGDELTPAEQAVYAERVRLNVEGRAADPSGLALYQPLEDVPGATPYVPLPERPPAERTLRSDALETARDYAARNHSSALLVWRRGKVELAAYFQGRDALTPVIARSLAKPVGTIAVGRALALGKVKSLDEAAADVITEWQGTPKGEILVRHLLDMRAGFLAQGPSFDPANIWTRAYLSPHHDTVMIQDYPLTHPPGSRYEYANTPSDLVAVLLERATGRRYAEFLSREVFQPLGAPAGKVWINRPGGMAHSGCCLLAPAELWLRLGILLLQEGRWDGRQVLPSGYAAEMRTATPQNPWSGMSVYLAGPWTERRGAGNPDLASAPKTWHSEPYLDRDLYLFDGNGNQVVYVVPSLEMVIVRTGDEPPRAPEWDNAFLPNLLIRAARLGPEDRRPIPQPGP